jgi:hypothetical protein
MACAGEGGVLNLWDINTAVLQLPDGQSQTSTVPLPWDDLLGGGDQVAELRDYFTTMQLQQAARGVGAAGLMERQQLRGKLHSSALPDLLRAGGFYPTQAQVEAALNHVRHLAGLGPVPKQALASPGAELGATGDKGTGRPSSTGARARARSKGGAAAASSGGAISTGLRSGSASSASSMGGARAGSAQSQAGLGPGSAEPQEDPEDEGLEFDQLLSVLVNHQPVTPVTQEEIEAAFAALGASTAAGGCDAAPAAAARLGC